MAYRNEISSASGRWSIVRLFWPLVILLLLGAAACGGDTPEGFGPLAVIDDLELRHAAGGGTGFLEIGDSCVTMRRLDGETVLLVWRTGDVQWDEGSRQITFSHPGRPGVEPVTIRDGDVISIGGVELPGDESRRLPWQRDLPWLATPHPSCPSEAYDVTFLSMEMEGGAAR